MALTIDSNGAAAGELATLGLDKGSQIEAKEKSFPIQEPRGV